MLRSNSPTLHMETIKSALHALFDATNEELLRINAGCGRAGGDAGVLEENVGVLDVELPYALLSFVTKESKRSSQNLQGRGMEHREVVV